MGDFDGRHNTALPVGTPKNGSKVLNRNNLRATRPNGDASLHLPSELIRNNIYVDCSMFVDLLLSSLFDQSLRVGQSFRVTVFSQDFRLERTEHAVLMNRR
jgi:hypothetical protein